MAGRKKEPQPRNSDEQSELTRKLLAVTLYQGGANKDVIARITGKAKQWVVDTLKGLPERKRKS